VEGNVVGPLRDLRGVVRVRASLLVLSVAISGCYDLEHLDPGPKSQYLLIDDFEDRDGYPSASQFGSWRARGFNADNNPDLVQRLDVLLADGDYALLGEFNFIDPGNANNTGVDLGVSDAGSDPVDARVFRSFHFSARGVPAGPPLPTLTRYYVQLGCDGAPARPGWGSPFWIQHNVRLSPDWQAQSLSLDAFAELGSEDPKIEGGAAACLAVVDSVRFNVATVLSDGASVTGSLYIDDVYFD
jgi:hypothetical protein